MKYRTMAQWDSLDDRVRNSKSGPWKQVALDTEEFLGLMNQLRILHNYYRAGVRHSIIPPHTRWRVTTPARLFPAT